jgi:hypothetical protein
MTARFAPGEPRRNGASSRSGPGPRCRSRRRRGKTRQSGQYCRSRRAGAPGSGDRGGPLCFSVRPVIEAIRAACAIGGGSRRLISRLAAEFVPSRINDFCKREIGRIAPTAARAVQSISSRATRCGHRCAMVTTVIGQCFVRYCRTPWRAIGSPRDEHVRGCAR